MNVTLNVPSTVSIRRGPLVGLFAGVAMLTAVVTWSLTVVAVDAVPAARTTSSASERELASRTPAAHQYVEGVSALSPLELAAAYGTAAVAADLARQHYVDAVSDLTDEQLAAGFSREPVAASAVSDAATGRSSTASEGRATSLPDDVGTVPHVVLPRLRVR